jgi:hypothetical protein
MSRTEISNSSALADPRRDDEVLKTLERPRWISSLFSVFDQSKGNCIGDLLEEYEEIIETNGRLRATKWLSAQVTGSISYLTRGRSLNISGVSRTWSRGLEWLRSLRVVFAPTRPSRVWNYGLAMSLLLALSLLIFYFYFGRPKRSNLVAELVSLNNFVDPRNPTFVLKPTMLVRGPDHDLTRIEIDYTSAIVQLQIELPQHQTALAYKVRLRRVDVGELFTIEGLKRLDNNAVSLVVPTRVFEEGDYLLTVLEDDVPLQDYVFRVMRKQVATPAR